MFDTPNEWIALALALLGGLLLGLALHPGGRKWRSRYLAERDAYAAARRDSEAKLSASEVRLRELEADRGRIGTAEARVAELERDRAELERDRAALEHDRAALAQANARIAELERDNARLHQAPVVAPLAVAPHPQTIVSAEPMPLTRRVVGGSRSGRGWFDWGPGSDPRARRG